MPTTNAHTGEIALVTGANRGLGLEICRQLAQLGLQVILTSRDIQQGEQAAARLRSAGLTLAYHPLDVTKPEQVQAVCNFVRDTYGRLDVLVNNAGVYLEPCQSVLEASIQGFEHTLAVNFYGPLYLTQAFIPLMQANHYGRVVNVSSIGGSLALMSTQGGAMAAYRVSKAALNALTRLTAAAVRGDNIKVNAMCPGNIRTDMGGPQAKRSPAKGAETVIWLATLPASGPSGLFFKDRQRLDW